MHFGGEERPSGALNSLAEILNVCSDHLVAKKGMSDILKMLLMGLEGKAPMENRMSVL